MNNKNTLIKVNCPICNSNNSRFLFSTKDYQFAVDNQSFALQRCLQCGVGYLSPRPLQEDMCKYYPEDFYWSLEGPELEKTKNNLLEARIKQLHAKYDVLKGLSPGTLLDVGTQKGEFIYFMQTKGWKVAGVEFSKTPDNLFDVPIHYGEFLDLDFKEDEYDCITMWAVLEHVYEPALYVKKISALIKPGGKFVGLVTNLNSIQSRWYQKDDYPRHLTIFTKGSLYKLLKEQGFNDIKIWTDQKIFGGPLSGGITYLFKRLAGYNREDVMREWHDRHDDKAFCGKFRGRPSLVVRTVNKIDSLILGILEPVLDKLGYGQLLLWNATMGAKK